MALKYSELLEFWCEIYFFKSSSNILVISKPIIKPTRFLFIVTQLYIIQWQLWNLGSLTVTLEGSGWHEEVEPAININKSIFRYVEAQ